VSATDPHHAIHRTIEAVRHIESARVIDLFRRKAAPASASLQTASCQCVYKRYGELGAAMTANVIAYRGKSAAREVGKPPSQTAGCRSSSEAEPHAWNRPRAWFRPVYPSGAESAGPDLRKPGSGKVTAAAAPPAPGAIRPALERAGIQDKVIGWHSFRYSLATNLRAAGVDLKTARELLRQAKSRITLEVYTRAISATKREANDRVMQMVFEAEKKSFSAPSSARAVRKRRTVAMQSEGHCDAQHPRLSLWGIATNP
jgi:hypothetical protein